MHYLHYIDYTNYADQYIYSVSVFSFFFLNWLHEPKKNIQFLIIHVLGIVCTYIMYKIFFLVP